MFDLSDRTNISLRLEGLITLLVIAHFQKEWQTGARVGSFGGTIMHANIFSPTEVSVYCSCVSEKILACAIVPPNNPTIERVHPCP